MGRCRVSAPLRTVWKFQARVSDLVSIAMPLGAEILHVAGDGPDRLVFWALVNTTAPADMRSFHVVGTGNWCPMVGPHVATVVAPPFVWHIFEVRR